MASWTALNGGVGSMPSFMLIARCSVAARRPASGQCMARRGSAVLLDVALETFAVGVFAVEVFVGAGKTTGVRVPVVESLVLHP